jgi:hypothetical protein
MERACGAAYKDHDGQPWTWWTATAEYVSVNLFKVMVVNSVIQLLTDECIPSLKPNL